MCTLNGQLRPVSVRDRSVDAAVKDKLTALFKTKTRAEWDALMEHTDVCYAPVLTMSEAAAHPHNVARGTFVEVAGDLQPAPAPRFDRTPSELPAAAPVIGRDSLDILRSLGHSQADIGALVAAGVVQGAPG